MVSLKDILQRIVKPNIIIKSLLFILSGISIVFTFVFGKSFIAVPFLSYALTAYTLAVIIAGAPDALRKGKKALFNNPYSSILINDVKLRTRLRLTFGLFLNLFYAVFKLFTGIFMRSEWLISVAAYYLLMCSSKFMLLRSANIEHSNTFEQRRYELKYCRYVGLLLFVAGSAISVMAAHMIYKNKTMRYPTVLFGFIAVYTAYRLISAIYTLIKYRKADNPFYSTTKALDLAAAFMALLTFQTALLAKYSYSPNFTRTLNIITSAIVLISVLVISINIIVRSTKKLKTLIK